MATGILAPDDHDDVATFAEHTESLGYDAFWVTELWGRDAFVALTLAAERTETIDLGTAIVNAYGRSPATLAQAAATLADAAEGRVRLGVGTSTEKVVEDLHGMAFDNPPRRLHEAMELAKAFLEADGRVEYDGEVFDVADFPSLETPLPVYAAALGPANRRATGRVADGWLPHNIPFDRLPEAFEVIADAAREAGRDPGDFEVAPYVPAAVTDDPAEARDIIRGHVAYYAGSGAGYRRAIGAYFDETESIAAAWQDGDRDLARERVTDEMVDALGVAGTESGARKQLERVRDVSVVDEPIVVMPGGADEETMDRTIDALAPSRS